MNNLKTYYRSLQADLLKRAKKVVYLLIHLLPNRTARRNRPPPPIPMNRIYKKGDKKNG